LINKAILPKLSCITLNVSFTLPDFLPNLNDPFNLTLLIAVVAIWTTQIVLYYKSCKRHLSAELVIRKNERKSFVRNMGFALVLVSVYGFLKFTNSLFFIYFLLMFIGNLVYWMLNSKYQPGYLFIQQQSICVNGFRLTCHDLSELKDMSFDGLYHVLKLKFNSGKSLKIRTYQIEKSDYNKLLKAIIARGPNNMDISDNLIHVIEGL